MNFIVWFLAIIFAIWVFKCSKSKAQHQPKIVAKVTIETDDEGSYFLTKIVNGRRSGTPVFLPSEASPDKINRTADEMAEEIRRENPSLR